MTIPQTGECGTAVKGVRGYIYDSLYNPVEGANVTVTMKDTGGTPTATYYFDESLSNGYYSVTFAMAEWEEDYTIEVTAELGAYESMNWTTADDSPFQTVNVTLLTVIPEFGDILGSPAVFVVLVTLAMFIVISRKRR